RPMHVRSGGDLTVLGEISVTHQPTGTDDAPTANETSYFEAGRDLTLELSRWYSPGPLKIGGPGELLVLAGRNIDLGAGTEGPFERNSAGVVSVGNTENGLLPKTGAGITVIAGLRADGSD